MFENHLNHVILVFIGKLSLKRISDEYPFARVSVFFSGFLHHFALAKVDTSVKTVNAFMPGDLLD